MSEQGAAGREKEGPGNAGPPTGASASTGEPAGAPAGERVVIRDRRKIDPTGGARRSTEPGRAGRSDAAGEARSGPRSGGRHSSADDQDTDDPYGGQHAARDGGDLHGDDPHGDRDPEWAESAPGSGGRRAGGAGAPDRRDPGDLGPADRVDAGSGRQAAGSAEGSRGDAGRDGPVRSTEDGQSRPASAPGGPAGTDAGEPSQATDGRGGGDGKSAVREPAVLGTDQEIMEQTAEGSGDEAAEGQPLGAELEALRAELDERTKDLQRLTAEYANYRKRVDRDRGLMTEQATGAVLSPLLPVLDDLDRAREHGDLVGPFGAVAEQLVAALTKFGLTPFGEKGDPFDPMRHEAVAHQTSPEVTEPTCVDVMRRGYQLGNRLLRPALVAVADPE